MAFDSAIKRSDGFSAGFLLASAVTLLALPSAVLAISSRFDTPRFDIVVPNSAQSAKLAVRLAPTLAAPSLASQSLFHFTPAGVTNRTDRSVTVAVRVDPQWAHAAMNKGANRISGKTNPSATLAQIAPMAFNLGVARGYQNFSQSVVPAASARKLEMPDLASIKGSKADDASPSRFNPKIVLDQKLITGRAPRTYTGGGQIVDVGGSYRIMHNLDVTAGVRYSQERERLQALTDNKKDNQAVYVGTQFRF